MTKATFYVVRAKKDFRMWSYGQDSSFDILAGHYLSLTNMTPDWSEARFFPTVGKARTNLKVNRDILRVEDIDEYFDIIPVEIAEPIMARHQISEVFFETLLPPEDAQRLLGVSFSPERDELELCLAEGVRLCISRRLLPELSSASPEMLEVVLSPAGGAIDFPQIDQHFDVDGLLGAVLPRQLLVGALAASVAKASASEDM